MSLLDGLRHRLAVFLRQSRYARELDEELRFHLDMETLERQTEGRGTLTPAQARAAARRRLGNEVAIKEETRRAAGLGLLDGVRQDLQFALRTFRRTPTFTVVAVLTLAIGIGANTAIFSAVDALLLRPLPYPEPDRLMTLSLTVPGHGDRPARDDVTWSYPKFVALRESQRIFSDLTLWVSSEFTLRNGADVLRVSGEYIDAHYLPTLGVRVQLGRGFQPADDADMGGARVAVISDPLWRLLYNADPAILGAMLDVDGRPYTIVGVAAPEFRGLSGQATFWMPIASSPPGWNVTVPWNHNYFAVARLEPGVSVDRAKAEVQRLGTLVDAVYPSPVVATEHWGAVAHELDSARVDARVRRTLLILFVAVGLVLLIACANVANLFLVHAAGRRAEIAVRLAIGAGRRRLVRQLLAESLLLSLSGGIASLVVAWVGVHVLADVQPARVLRLQDVAGLGALNFTAIRLDGAALSFTAALALTTGILFGLVPALQATRPSLTHALQEQRAARTGTLRRLNSRNVLVVLEIALAVVLLAGSGLMLRSLGHLLEVRPGFTPERVLSLRVNRAPAWAFDSIARFYDVAVERLSALPGVTDVALEDCPPLQLCAATDAALPDRPPVPRGTEPVVGVHWITPAWPAVMGVPLLRGRLFDTRDRRDGRKVVLVSETAAKRLWPGEDPIGRPLLIDGAVFEHDTAYVAGVVGDVLYETLDQPPRSDVYVSYYQAPFSYRMMLFLRTRGEPAGLVRDAVRAMHEVAPGFPVYDIDTMSGRMASSTAYARFSALVLGLFAALALALACMGTYGVISYGVAQRTREIGVRTALGATRGDVVGLVVGQGITLAAIGALLGLAGALGATRALRSLLYDVQPGDPLTLASIIGVLLIAVLVACFIPARRAATVPAIQALRSN